MDLFPAIATFCMVIFILYLSYVFSKFVAKRTHGGVNGQYMQVLDRVYVGQDRYLLIVEVGEKKMIIGVTPSTINLISSLSEEDLLLAQSSLKAKQAEPGVDFKEILKGLMDKKKPKP